MANSYSRETLREALAINTVRIARLIGDLSRSVAILTADIDHEEIRSGTRDWADPNYPMLARNRRARMDNNEATIASLEALVQGTQEAA